MQDQNKQKTMEIKTNSKCFGCFEKEYGVFDKDNIDIYYCTCSTCDKCGRSYYNSAEYDLPDDLTYPCTCKLTTCMRNGCLSLAKYGFEEYGYYCFEHKEVDDVLSHKDEFELWEKFEEKLEKYTQPLCIHEDCITIAVYGNWNENFPIFCNDHKNVDDFLF
jgi:hypothetical protein